MNIELFLILSATYEYTREPAPEEDRPAYLLRHYIKGGIEKYMHRQGYTYNETTYKWVAVKEKI